MRILVLEPVGGIAGDMTVAALVALGVPLERLRAGLAALPVDGLRVSTRREARHHIAGTRFVVEAPDAAATAAGEHAHRTYAGIRAMLAHSALPPGVQDTAGRIFRALAEAEGHVHDLAPEEVTFHEVGAWDAIADIVCTALAVEHLRPDAVYCTPVPLGTGTVAAAHGTLPVPAPATLHLLRGFPVVYGGPAFERTTPTGAAVLAALARPLPEALSFVPERVGIGLGARDDPAVPNVLRAVLGRAGADAPAEGLGRETVECAETNVDDASGEWLGFLMERLTAAGALDVLFLPAQMKKGRPGTLVQVLYRPAQRETIRDVLFAETTTLGVRWHTLQRAFLPREAATVDTPWGQVAGKVSRHGSRVRFAPEFEACRRIAADHGVPLPEVYEATRRAFAAQQGEGD